MSISLRAPGPAAEALIKEFAFPTEHLDMNSLHLIYKRHVSVTWDMQETWGHYAVDNISSSKTRELSSVAIHKHLQEINSGFWDAGPDLEVLSKMPQSGG